MLIPAAGLTVGALAVLFTETTDKGADLVLFSGQEQLPGLVNNAGSYSLGVLGMIILCKGLAWSVSLGSFRGGPTFPAIFLGAAGGIAASHLPGMALTPAVAVGMGAAVVAVLKLPLSAVIIATALTISGGPASVPLIIVGVVVAYLVTLALEGRLGPRQRAGRPGRHRRGYGSVSDSFHSRMRQAFTTPLRTNGSPSTNAWAASRVVNTAIEPSSCGLAKVPTISNVPAAWNSSSHCLCAGKCAGAFDATSSADS